ncbi:Tyrosine aminotransferase [Tolypocladium ophioglossoides CBS 100239]|uniref:Tyrosine aminotransferase n=1 Tax=Tolypocladium ophioglossoides (strain CBS 100239) TaxID=1163406 RepID=A0A0L0NE05_TOLOC|nr:Tyrosine aminotransferase [Tolypocladium ophioglossoides CBS 100239]
MKNVQAFKMDQWSSYASALSVNDRRKLSSNPDLEVFDPELKLTYGSFEGSLKLRERIAEVHSSEETKLTADNVLVTPGSIMANFLILDTIYGSGDHIICQYPTFGQLYRLPEFNDVDVGLWKMDEENSWMPSIDELVTMIKPNTKAIILNNPSNPTGAVLPKELLLQVADVASKSNITILCDEVFNPLFFTEPKPPSFVTLGYTNSVVTGSLSKAFAIPGVRLGWIVTQDAELLRKVGTTRDYTTISVSQLDDSVAAFALGPAVLPGLMKRNLALCEDSISQIEDFVKRNEQRCRWIKSSGAGTAFVQVLDRDGKPVDDTAFSKKLSDEESVCVIPGGHCFGEGGGDDFKGYVRIALGDPELLRESLPLLERFIQNM